MSRMVSVYIDGQEGTTGLQLQQRLAGRADLRLAAIPDALRKDAATRKQYLNDADVVFLCLPDVAAVEAVGMIENPAVRVLDASTAHRVAADWLYGFPELSAAQRDSICQGKRVAVPGCHASGFVALAAPMVAAGLLPPDYPVSVHSITGYTGGGKKMIADYEAADRAPAFSGTRLYALGLAHKHLPEMHSLSGLVHAPLFTPILGDFAQGMLVSIPLHTRLLPAGTDPARIHAALASHYAGSRFVEVMPYDPKALPDGGFLDPQALNGTNRMQLFVFGHAEQVLVTARLDNLGKGASGAAVQCFNLMVGAPEEQGLL